MIKVVAFDFFDTLVHRDCSPEVVIYDWARQLSAMYEFKISPRNIFDIRKSVEKKRNLNNKTEELSYDELINGIYETIKNQIEEISRARFIDNAFLAELNSELRHIYIDKENCKLLNEISQDKRVVLISDFYCKTELFERILDQYNLSRFFYRIYISSDIGLRKSTGSLYRHVLSDMHISPEEMLMMGDNPISDVNIPQKLGIIVKPLPFDGIINNTERKDVIHAIRKASQKDLLSGYAPIVLLFLNKIYIEAVRQHVDTLLFCAREGQDLLYLFNEFQRVLYPDHIINTRYFYVSRRATLSPSLDELEREDFGPVFRQFTQLTVRDFLFSIGFNDDEISDICDSIPLSSRDYVSNSPRCMVLSKLRSNEFFKEKYDSKRISNKKMFLAYLYELIGDSKKVSLVDIGWKGTIQDNIRKVLGEEYTVRGFYFGLNENANRSEDNQKYGLIFDCMRGSKNNKALSYNYVYLESVFAANHGQTVGYRFENDLVSPLISDDLNDVQIFKYVETKQKFMNNTVLWLITIISNSMVDPVDIEYQITSSYISFLMKNVPRDYMFFLNLRKKVKENFGNISNIETNNVDFVLKDRQAKKAFLYVDYIYRLMDRFHLKICYPIATIYCNLAYFLKRNKIKR